MVHLLVTCGFVALLLSILNCWSYYNYKSRVLYQVAFNYLQALALYLPHCSYTSNKQLLKSSEIFASWWFLPLVAFQVCIHTLEVYILSHIFKSEGSTWLE